MAVRTELSDKWVRGFVGDIAVVDSRSPVLFWEERFPVPGYAFDLSDVRMDLLHPSNGDPPKQPFFFLPKGPVAAWYDLQIGPHRLPHVGWVRDDPALRDRVIFNWQPGLIDRWMEEDEAVGVHPRDPHKRVEAIASSRRVTVSANGVVLADSGSPVLLFETGLPTRYYLPESDVNMSELTPVGNVSHCPYKGVADRYWDVGDELSQVAWSYSRPFPAVAKVAGLISFYNEMVDMAIDGVAVSRPVSVFSDPANRPTS